MRAFWLTSYEPEVQAELFQLGHRNMLTNVFSAVVLRALMTMAVWSSVAHARIGAWLAISVPSILLALGLWWWFRSQARLDAAPGPKTMRRWMLGHAVVMSLFGLSSGAIGLLFGFDPTLDLLIACAFVASAAYSVAGNATHDLLAFFLTILFGGAAITAFLPNAFGDASAYMIAMTWLYMTVLCMAAYHSHGTVIRSVRLRMANAALAEKNARAAARADQANRDKSDFLAAASHDLRQPVHALLMFVEALRRLREGAFVGAERRSSDVAQDQLVGHIAAAGQSIGTMFNELMELSRLESGGEQAHPTAIALAPLLQQCVDTARAQAEQKLLRLRLRVSRAATHCVVQADRALLTRVVANLLGNAVRYTAAGGVLVSLRIRDGGALELAVTDTGIGIDAMQHQRIFEPYVQIGNAERDRSKGLGLGLAIVRQSLQLMGLALQLRSAPGRGSRFSLRFAQWRQAELAPAANPLPDPRVVRSLAGRRVLLVDDDPMVRQALATLLGGWDVDLRTMATASGEAVDELHRLEWQPDCILCDYRLPGPRNGIAVLGELLERFPGAIGMLQTGERAERVQAEADDAGFVVLYKPVSAADLASALSAVLRATGPAPLMAQATAG